ncbi:MAG: YraN family protein, partial [Meiothermus sp.]|uniref:YraN family protein n=1 Tax=Meiothermus sp. TaxID=1955249 RepID=UPI002619A1AF
CFVEIKARTRSDYGGALGAVTVAKQRRLARAARLYLAETGLCVPCRFDVVALERDEEGCWNVRLVRNAFEAPAP